MTAKNELIMLLILKKILKTPQRNVIVFIAEIALVISRYEEHKNTELYHLKTTFRYADRNTVERESEVTPAL